MLYVQYMTVNQFRTQGSPCFSRIIINQTGTEIAGAKMFLSFHLIRGLRTNQTFTSNPQILVCFSGHTYESCQNANNPQTKCTYINYITKHK